MPPKVVVDIEDIGGSFKRLFIQPAAGTAQHFAYQRLWLPGSLDRPLRHILQQSLAFELSSRVRGHRGEFAQSCFQNFGDRVSRIRGTGRHILNCSIEFLICHHHARNPSRRCGIFASLLISVNVPARIIHDGSSRNRPAAS